jgi:hypothetical protein
MGRTNDELVTLFRHTLRTELQGGEELRSDGGNDEYREGEQQVGLNLTPRRLTEVGFADIEERLNAVHVRLKSVVVEVEVLDGARQVGSGLSFPHGGETRVEKLVRSDRECVVLWKMQEGAHERNNKRGEQGKRTV